MSHPRRGTGCIPLRPLAIGEILDGSMRALRRNPRTMLGASAIVAVLRGVALAVLELSLLRSRSSDVVVLTYAMVVSVFGAFLGSAITLIVAQDVLGVRLSGAGVWRLLRRRVAAVVGVAIIGSVVEIVALFPVVVPGVILWVYWAVGVPVVMIERTGWWAGLRRSWRLVLGSFWRVVGVRLLTLLVVGILTLLIILPFLLLATTVKDASLASQGLATTPAYVAITILGSTVAAALTGPISAGVSTLLYLDLRMRKEGLDLDLAYGISPTVDAAA